MVLYSINDPNVVHVVMILLGGISFLESLNNFKEQACKPQMTCSNDPFCIN